MFEREPLSSDLVEKGVIFKRQIVVLGDYEIGLLTLNPYSKIRRHEHKENWEIYIDLTYMNVIDVCGIGQEHELENVSAFERKEVLYIKGNNGVPIPKEFLPYVA